MVKFIIEGAKQDFVPRLYGSHWSVMRLSDGFFEVPSGKVSAIVTYLQMFNRPPLRPGPHEEWWTLKKAEFPRLDDYRLYFRKIGQDWLWFSRLKMGDDELTAILDHPRYETYALSVDGENRGLLELDFRFKGESEISFFGLTPDMLGRGAGRWLMNRAMEIAWSRPIERLWLHTCTFDHPAAVEFYVRSGFEPYRRQVEVADDPRIIGLLPKKAAPQVPLID